MTGVSEWNRQLLDASRALDDAHLTLDSRTREYAEADLTYRRANARAMIRQKGEKGTVPEKQAIADLEVAEVRYAAQLAEGLKIAALEAVRSRRAQLGAVQSLVSLAKSEADLAKWGPT
jgi:hypothetical protein